eukprot:TRINITY_DN608_c0_g2_i1.p1 TRINITY_DN608_c0_g2~~TRINITY_DN608_c0_g2_i1.p1  ORF type:complete len:300 (+),score=50.85 TRINITY_DN608_c0_g2_i1:76-975(+)
MAGGRKRVLAFGLGNMGFPLTGCVAAKYATCVHDLRSDVVARHNAEFGTTPCEDTRREAATADVILTCLPNTDLTFRIVKDIAASLRPGVLWIDATSGRAADARRLAETLWSEHQVRYADCAVSGGPAGARRGKLAVMVGGAPDAVGDAMAVCSTFGASGKVFHCGPPGSGHAVKAVNNALLAVSLLAAGEGIGTLTAMGVDPETAAKAISASSGRSWATMQRMPDHILPNVPYGFALALHRKDVDNALKLVGDAAAPMLQQAGKLMREAEAELGGSSCHCDVAQRAAVACGGSLRAKL